MPFAGGNPDLFESWAAGVADDVEVLAVRLPGHGSRMRELPFTDWADLIGDTCAALDAYLGRPHALYGHCFGGRLAYEVARRSAALGNGRLLRRLFVSCCRSPDAAQAGPYVHEMPDREFCEALAQTGAAPPEVLTNDAFMRILLPAVRAEIRLAELWGDRGASGIDAPITAIRGRDDTSEESSRMHGWSAYTSERCEFIEVPGGHFFLTADPAPVVELVNSRLASVACTS